MRLFVAVDVDAGTREAARRLRAGLARDRPAVERALRWVEPMHLHLTLRFLGDRDDVDRVRKALAPLLTEARFSVEWTVPGWLPPAGRPRVFYVGAGTGAGALESLAAEVSARLSRIGTPPEARSFTPHLTLARVRDTADPGLARQIRSLVPPEPFAGGLTMPIESIVLYESQLSPQGPRYTALARSPLS